MKAVLASLMLVASTAQAAPQDLSFFVLVKSSNYAQSTDGKLTLLNYHFFSELFLAPDGKVTRASLSRDGAPEAVIPYEDKGKTFYVEGGHFDSEKDVDAAYPNGTYRFRIETAKNGVIEKSLPLAGPDGKTDIPAPITISLYQNGQKTSPAALKPATAVTVRWSAYSNGRADPNGIVDDMIFVVVADCAGKRVFHTGLPFAGGDYMTYRTREVTVPADRFEPGKPYSIFVEFPHVAGSGKADGTPGFTSFATATYLDMKTTGVSDKNACPAKLPPMDTGQTDRMNKAAKPH
ncbi:hypothetical protein [Govanella unica]|uniref:DUF4198 domain-containing protein n=1 Tax=Govanella unica TaxID=2975056 RepID=A0A9X3TVA9_9PROT|nr:hypothetical protein [Govania unica]MDA5192430.1 hypothetical protein [Govania unica]